MPAHSAPDIITRLTTAQLLDNGRPAGDRFLLTAALRTDVDGDLAALAAAQAGTAPAEGGRAGASGTRRAALDELERQLRGGYNFIVGIDETTITGPQRLQVFTSYGWPGGEIGRFDDERTVALGRLAPTVSAAELGNAAWLYPAARLARIAAQVAIIDGTEATASGGESQQATLVRDTALGLAAGTLLRVRHFYCSATRDGDQTPELVKIGFQPRRDPGEVGETPAPPVEVPGQAVIGSAGQNQQGREAISGFAAGGEVATWAVGLKGPGETEFTVVEEGLTENGFIFEVLPAGDYEVRVAAENAAGRGEWSDAIPFTIA